jgi:hypothetical protein
MKRKQDGAFGHLRGELAALNRRIGALEKKDDRTPAEVEALKTSALALARQIDKLGNADDSFELLRR